MAALDMVPTAFKVPAMCHACSQHALCAAVSPCVLCHAGSQQAPSFVRHPLPLYIQRHVHAFFSVYPTLSGHNAGLHGRSPAGFQGPGPVQCATQRGKTSHAGARTDSQTARRGLQRLPQRLVRVSLAHVCMVARQSVARICSCLNRQARLEWVLPAARLLPPCAGRSHTQNFSLPAADRR